MPWGETWDEDFLAQVRELVALRRDNETLGRGGIRWARADEDTLAFIRETRGERLLVVASREPFDLDSHDPLYDSPQFKIRRLS